MPASEAGQSNAAPEVVYDAASVLPLPVEALTPGTPKADDDRIADPLWPVDPLIASARPLQALAAPTEEGLSTNEALEAARAVPAPGTASLLLFALPMLLFFGSGARTRRE